MPQIETILCPIDFSEFSVTAYEYARSLAWRYKAKLLLQHVLYPFYSSSSAHGSHTDSYEEIFRKLRVDAEHKLQRFAKRYGPAAIQPQCVVGDGSVTDLILSLAEKQAVNLIVMGTHGLRGVDRFMLGSATERVLRRAKCPVLAVRKPPHHITPAVKDPEPIHIGKMILCSDFSDHAHRASEYAVSMAREYGAELTLLHVLDDIPRSEDFESAAKKVATRLEESVAPKLREGCHVKVLVRVGEPYQQIVQLAVEAQTDLVIMGVRGRGALEPAIFGSTTYRVMQLGPCPVLAVHI